MSVFEGVHAGSLPPLSPLWCECGLTSQKPHQLSSAYSQRTSIGHVSLTDTGPKCSCACYFWSSQDFSPPGLPGSHLINQLPMLEDNPAPCPGFPPPTHPRSLAAFLLHFYLVKIWNLPRSAVLWGWLRWQLEDWSRLFILMGEILVATSSIHASPSWRKLGKSQHCSVFIKYL